MMIWLAEWWVFATALIVIFVPGAVAALVLGMRGFSVLAVSGPLSLAGIGAASMVGVVVPARWSPLAWAVSVLALVLLAVLLAAAQRRWGGGRWREQAPARRWLTWAPFLAVGLAAALLTPRLLSIFADPQNISQTFDNIYHLNAVRYVLDTGSIAPTKQLIAGFYPSLWHAITATVTAISGASIPAAVNAVSVALGAVLWPVGCVWLVRQIAGNRPSILLVTGALSISLAAFPILMLDFGVLYPNVLSIALLPAALAALLDVTGIERGERPPRLLRWAVLLAVVPTLALAHPSTLMAFFVIGAWPALAGALRWLREARGEGRSRRRLLGGLTLWTVGLIGTVAMLVLARPTPAQAFWGPSMGPGNAVLQVLTNSILDRPWAIVTSGLAVIGIAAIAVRRRQSWWLVAAWGALLVIYVVCASVPAGALRYGLTGTWYSDLFRIAALLPVVVVPLGALGFAWTLDAVLRKHRGATRVLATTLALVVVLVTTQLSASMTLATDAARWIYRSTTTSPLLTTHERALIERLPQHVAPDEVIFGSPWTGASLSYALADRSSLIPHIYAELDQVLSTDIRTIVDRLNQASDDPEVCAALRNTNTRWVLDFGSEEIHNANHSYAGMVDLAESGVVELVDSEGPDARLYRITACDFP